MFSLTPGKLQFTQDPEVISDKQVGRKGAVKDLLINKCQYEFDHHIFHSFLCPFYPIHKCNFKISSTNVVARVKTQLSQQTSSVKKKEKNSAHADGGPPSRVCAR